MKIRNPRLIRLVAWMGAGVIRLWTRTLRVRTDSAIRSVVAVFPFGLIKPLKYLKDEDVWQTRFLAPAAFPGDATTLRSGCQIRRPWLLSGLRTM